MIRIHAKCVPFSFDVVQWQQIPAHIVDGVMAMGSCTRVCVCSWPHQQTTKLICSLWNRFSPFRLHTNFPDYIGFVDDSQQRASFLFSLNLSVPLCFVPRHLALSLASFLAERDVRCRCGHHPRHTRTHILLGSTKKHPNMFKSIFNWHFPKYIYWLITLFHPCRATRAVKKTIFARIMSSGFFCCSKCHRMTRQSSPLRDG